MLRRDVLKVGLLTIAGVGLPPLRSSEVRAEAGWITLFDGKTLDNWNSIGTAKWKVEDGAAVADNGNGFLVSKTPTPTFSSGSNSGSRPRPTAASSFAAPIRAALAERPPTRSTSGTTGRNRNTAPAPSLTSPRSIRCRTPAANGTSMKSRRRATHSPSSSTDKRPSTAPMPINSPRDTSPCSMARARPTRAAVVKFRKVEIKPL